MRTRLFQAVVIAAALTAGATASSPVLSADLYGAAPSYDATPVPPQDVFEGWYLGGTLGGSWVSYDLAPASPGSVDSSGVLGGVIGGYSWQHGPFVIGVEGDFMAADISGDKSFNGGLNKASPGFDTMADLRLRAGYTICRTCCCSERSAALGRMQTCRSAAPAARSARTTFFGWSAGGGAEYAFDQNWSARLRLPVHRFRLRYGVVSGRQGDLRPGRQHIPRLGDLPLLRHRHGNPRKRAEPLLLFVRAASLRAEVAIEANPDVEQVPAPARHRDHVGLEAKHWRR